MNVLDRARIEWAVYTFEWWLDLRGTPARRRRDLRCELRANLRDAAARTGGRAAVAALGSTRQLAREAGLADPTRPRWSAGLNAAMLALLVIGSIGFFAAFAWFDGVRSAAPARTVTGSITFFPGSTLGYTPEDDGFSTSFALGWLPFVLAFVAFCIVARPWRPVTGRRGAADLRYTST